MIDYDKIYLLKVRENKANNQKTITIPKEAEGIEAGDYVEVKKHAF